MTEGQKFLEWYADNYEEVQKAIRKNITYEEELFEDVIGDTVIKVYESIEKGTEVENYKNFFFICAKFNYINAQNKLRTRRSQEDRDFIGWGDIEDEPNIKERRVVAIKELYQYIADYIEDYFPSNEVDLFIIYHKLKSEGNNMSYEKMSKITGQSISYITKTLKKIKEFVNANEDIIKKKNTLLDECLD